MTATHTMIEGGSHPANVVNMQPGAVDSNALPFEAADHQRTRSYQLNRAFDFRPLNPIGGIDVRVRASDRDYLDGHTIADGDSIRAIYVPKGFRIEFVHAKVVAGDATFDFDVQLHENGSSGDVTGVTALGDTGDFKSSARLDTLITHDDAYIEVLLNTNPVGGDLKNARFEVMVEMVNVNGGGYFNGNEASAAVGSGR